MQSLSRYFVAYENTKIPYKYGPRDQNGIPQFDPKKMNLSGEISYHPIAITQYALGNWNLWVDTQASEALNECLKCAYYLAKNSEIHPKYDFVTWSYHFALRAPKVNPPWISGMAQGQILSLFQRAFDMTKDDLFLRIGQKVVQSFFIEVSEGGCVTMNGQGAFIQEVAAYPLLYILNGANYALIGLFEFYSRFLPDQLNEIEPFVIAIEGRLEEFDTGYWSRYSLGMRFNLADRYYHQVHIDQLKYLGELMDRTRFKEYANRFQLYQKKYDRIIPIIKWWSLNTNRLLRIVQLDRILYKYRFS